MNTSEDGNIEAFGETTKAVTEEKVAEPAEDTDGVQVGDNASEAAASVAGVRTEDKAVNINRETTETDDGTVTESVVKESVARRTDDNSTT